MLKVLEHILMSRPAEHPESTAYSDAVKDLHADGTHELQRLAIKMPNQLLVSRSRRELVANTDVSQGCIRTARIKSTRNCCFRHCRQQAPDRLSNVPLHDYVSCLGTVMHEPANWLSHRATNVNAQIRLQKLQVFVQPIQQLWQTPELENALSSFDNFCDLMSLSSTREYLVSRHVHGIQEWSLYQLDAEGQAVQKQLEERLKVNSCTTDTIPRLLMECRHYL